MPARSDSRVVGIGVKTTCASLGGGVGKRLGIERWDVGVGVKATCLSLGGGVGKSLVIEGWDVLGGVVGTSAVEDGRSVVIVVCVEVLGPRSTSVSDDCPSYSGKRFGVRDLRGFAVAAIIFAFNAIAAGSETTTLESSFGRFKD